MKFDTGIQKLGIRCNDNTIYMKRDDLIPFSFGGNKVRKAVNFFEDMMEKGCDTVVTYGSSSSNHCRIIANMAAQNHIKCYVVSPEEDYDETYNSKMVTMFGAEIVKTPTDSVSATIDMLMQRLSKTCKPYFIYGGGHGNLGTKAYIDAYEEICAYEAHQNIQFDYIFHASGTGTTQAGLVAGKILNQREQQEIVGISIARSLPYGKEVVIKSVQDYFGDENDYSTAVQFDDAYICGGYGLYHPEVVQTIKDVLTNEGIALNTTYTGKAFWGMCKYLEANHISGKNVLFVNTGGGPLFFNDMEKGL